MNRSEFTANKELATHTNKVLTPESDLLNMRKPAKPNAGKEWVYNPHTKSWTLV